MLKVSAVVGGRMLLWSCSIPPEPAGSLRSGVVQLSGSYQRIMT